MKKIYEVHEYSRETHTGRRIKVCASPDAVIRFITDNNHPRFVLTELNYDIPLKEDMFSDGIVLKRKDTYAKERNAGPFLGITFEECSENVTREDYDYINQVFTSEEYKYYIVFEQELYE